ncbi:MAG: tRNA preQ1(34) S-adenosylmethionine ribosyltransferase-isomerase QueA [Rhodospirillaceae bacterium]|nr:tRNA preQ1(34) S-adenosylmethionine ribosyltransferase-isomerase QueA [Rhodospirillaceae bacterium]|tara:strand:- start:948 stop:1988 length:1041 start_codon:yes stop_codon:yes gene_type:complete
MHVDLFDYDLPPHYIAQHPVKPRDAARLLDLTKGGKVDRFIIELPEILHPGDLIIANNTLVIPTRLHGHRGKAAVEVTLHKKISSGTWLAFIRPAKRVKEGDDILFQENLSAKILSKMGGEILLDFKIDDSNLISYLQKIGEMPTPPYLKRPNNQLSYSDKTDYQSIFAKRHGAVAAPTASLHFTERLVRNLKAKEISIATVTLHVGAGTFLPVKADDTEHHEMHTEWAELDASTVSLIEETKGKGNRIVALGTTSLRVLETAVQDGVLRTFSGETNLFITPGYKFEVIDMLITNFHLPRSTLLMLVSALAGRERILTAYEHAKKQGYRFFSYGDACLIDTFYPSD